MNRRPSPLFGGAILLADAAVCSSLFAVFLLVETGRLVFPGPFLWAGCLLGCYGLLWLLLQKPRSQRTVILLCAGVCAGQMAAVFLLQGRFAGNMGMITAVIMWIASYFHCYNLALNPVPAEKILLAFEAGVLVLLFSLFYCSMQQTSYLCALPAAVSSLLALAALAAKRTAGGREKGGRSGGTAVLAGIIGLFTLAALAYAGLAAGTVKALALALWNGLCALAGFLARRINRFIRFLASLFPEPEYGEIPLEEPMVQPLPEGAVEGEQLISGETVLYILLGLAALALAVLLIRAVIRGGQRLHMSPAGGGRELRRQRPGLRALLGRWLGRVSARMAYAINAAVYRNTPPGLFVWLERRARRRRRGRRADETCREFLRRLAPDYPGAEAALETLVRELDAHYFGGGSVLSRREVRQLRRSLSRAGKAKT